MEDGELKPNKNLHKINKDNPYAVFEKQEVVIRNSRTGEVNRKEKYSWVIYDSRKYNRRYSLAVSKSRKCLSKFLRKYRL